MGYKTPQPDVTAFADQAQQNILRRVYERLGALEEVTQSQSSGRQTAGSSGRRSPAPPQAQLAVTTNPSVKGAAYVRITNPQFLGTKRNQVGSTPQHWVRASTSANFNQNITDFGVSPSTYLPVSELGSGTFYFEVRSSLDGKTFNNPVRSASVTIP